MPRLNFVKKARKDVPNTDIKAGESYFWWKFRHGGKHTSKTRPPRSQLTQSAYLSALYDLQDGMGETPTAADMEGERDNLRDELQGFLDEQQERLDSMPDQLRESSSSGEMLQTRIDSLENAISELENVDCSFDPENKSEEQSAEEYEEEWREQAWSEIRDAVNGVE